MRVLIVLLIFLIPKAYAESPPLDVLIIGVPSTEVAFYRDSPLGEEISNTCRDLQRYFKNGQARVTPLCTKEETTFAHVQDTLLKHFQAGERARITLLFIMTHGEPTATGDVRLLMSDTTDDNKLTRSLLVGTQLAPLITKSVGSASIGFVDACFSGAARTYALTNMGTAAEEDGVHAGLLASAQQYQRTFGLSFTKALMETWRTDCPQNPDDFISAVLGRMGNSGSSPTWLVTYHGSACFGELLATDKRVITIWRDPTKRIRVTLFDDKKSKALRTIPPGKSYVMPYVHALVPGSYRVETVDEEKGTLLDKGYCDFSTQIYCKYVYPSSAARLTLLNVEVESYRAAVRLGYDDDHLNIVSSRAGLFYGDLIAHQPRGGPKSADFTDEAKKKGKKGKQKTELAAGQELLGSVPQLWSDVQEYQKGTKKPYDSLLVYFDDHDVRLQLETGLSKIMLGDEKGALKSFENAANDSNRSKSLTLEEKEKLSIGLKSTVEDVKREGLSGTTVQKLEGAMAAGQLGKTGSPGKKK